MAQPKIKFERRNKTLVDVTTDADRTRTNSIGESVVMPRVADVACKSINAAKRLSRELQAKHGALCVRAVRP